VEEGVFLFFTKAHFFLAKPGKNEDSCYLGTILIVTSQKPLPIHKFWPIYSKIAPDGYRISPIGDGIGKF
jgi:hypothetical protein